MKMNESLNHLVKFLKTIFYFRMDENDTEFDSFIVPSSSNRKRKSFLPDRTGATDDTDFGKFQPIRWEHYFMSFL